MKKFGVVGAGTMGSGIAQKIALEGGYVTVVDLNENALKRGLESMETIFNESLKRKILNEKKLADIWSRITFSQNLESLADADLVVEAIFEDQTVKKDLFANLEEIVSADCVLASNTSSFTITALAQDLTTPERFVGLHFFFHPVKNRLLEIIPGDKTAASTLEKCRRFCALMGKVDILCSDTPGFVVNRFFVPWLNEGVRLVEEGFADSATVDATAEQKFKLGMGPFALMNATGVPIAYHAAEGLKEKLGAFYQGADLLKAQIDQGPWTIGSDGQLNELVFKRLFAAALVIGAQLVQEGSAKPLDIDLGARIGLRWPRGPFEMYNRLDPIQRKELLVPFRERYPDFPVPKALLEGQSFDLPGVVCDLAEGQADIVLSRPDKSNALDLQVAKDLEKAVDQSIGTGRVVLRGKGKNFAAGADLGFFIRNMESGDLDAIVEFTREGHGVFGRLENHEAQVHAAVDGFVLGGGAELMLCADVISATPRAVIGFPETGIGIYPGLGGTFRLARRVGKGLAKYLIGTGVNLNGEDALSIGLVDACVSPVDLATVKVDEKSKVDLTGRWKDIADFMESNTLDDLLNKSFSKDWQKDIQKRLKRKAPIALKMAMDLIEQNMDSTTEQARENELNHLKEIFSTQDALVGLKSVGKYRPEFVGQ